MDDCKAIITPIAHREHLGKYDEVAEAYVHN